MDHLTLIAHGTLKPNDDVKGCTFTISRLTDNSINSYSTYLVEIRSPYNYEETIAKLECSEEEIGPFLLQHREY